MNKSQTNICLKRMMTLIIQLSIMLYFINVGAHTKRELRSIIYSNENSLRVIMIDALWLKN
jgi:hypothetical protein